MIKQLLNSVVAQYHDLSVSRRSIICLSLRLRQIIDQLATDKLRYFARPRPIIVKYNANLTRAPRTFVSCSANTDRQLFLFITNHPFQQCSFRLKSDLSRCIFSFWKYFLFFELSLNKMAILLRKLQPLKQLRKLLEPLVESRKVAGSFSRVFVFR